MSRDNFPTNPDLLSEIQSGGDRNLPVASPNVATPNDTRKAGKLLEFTLENVKWRFRWCPSGSFLMGSSSSESDRYDDETQHKVTLTKGFWMLETQVTQEQWQAVTGSNPSEFKGSKLPLEQVSWNDCREFIKKLNTDISLSVIPAGLKFALPTEAQWEYACRAGSTTTYCFGNGERRLGDYAWYANNGGGRTHEVGTKKPNAWGLFDMHGNVWEWCADWFGIYGGDAADPMGASSGVLRVYRGGSWYLNAEYCRSAYRSYYAPGFRYDFLGLRISLVPQDE